MEDRIENHVDEFGRLCQVCKHANKCKDKKKICFAKKLAWAYARKVYKQRVKKGIIKE